ncbi:MAG TPA: ferritin family protein [Dissulfurispiraceae bacterium]|nr:ferritin family protein [Dissulfurispiraceae bacterium]
MTSVEIAAKMEADAIKFYREGAEKTRNPVGKKMFLSIAEDEKGHLQMLRSALEVCDLKITEAHPIKTVRTIFEEMKDSMMQRVEATTDELEAFRIAMEMEKEGIEFYRAALAETQSEKEKCLFERLIQEEEEHFKIFSETYEFMTDTGNWYMWDEHSIVEG